MRINDADDMRYTVGKAEEALQRLREITSKLRLTINEEKTRICKVPEGEPLPTAFDGALASGTLTSSHQPTLGEWKIAPEFSIHLKQRPKRRTIWMMSLFFGWKWIDAK